MSEHDILFYGERGIINGMLLDMYSDPATTQDKLNKFFGAVKLFSGTEVPWKSGVEDVKWIIEPHLSEFGNPDLISTFTSTSNRERYALFFEAKLLRYIDSCLKLGQDPKLNELKGNTSKLNLQLALCYRFTDAYTLAKNNRADKIVEIVESSIDYLDCKRRRLVKRTIIEAVHTYLKKISKFYYIAITNDDCCLAFSDEMDSIRPLLEKSCETQDENVRQVKSKKQVNSEQFGLLTYQALNEARVVSKEKGYFGKAIKMMDMKLYESDIKPASEDRFDQANRKDSEGATKIRRYKSVNFTDWHDAQKELSKSFLELIKKVSDIEFKPQRGSYSVTIPNNGVVMKLMSDPDYDDRLMLGLYENKRIPAEAISSLAPKKGKVVFCEKVFQFFSFNQTHLKQYINLALDYMDTWKDDERDPDVNLDK